MLGQRPPRRPRAPRRSARRARPVRGRARRAAAARPLASRSSSASAVRRSGAPPSRARPLATRSRTGADGSAGAGCQLLRPRPRHGDDEVEAVEERTRELVAERRQPLRRARALGGGIAAPAQGQRFIVATSWKRAGKSACPCDAGDRDDAVLERLAQRLERRPLELRQLVEEQDAAMREARLTRPRAGAAADDRRRRRAVVRSAERPPGDQRPLGREQPGDGVDPHHLERLARLERRQDRRQPARRASSCPSGRAREQKVVTAGGRELERAPGALLAADVGQVGRVGLGPPSGGSAGGGRSSPRRYATASARCRTGTASTPASAASRRRLGRAEEPLEPGSPRALGDRERAAHRPHPSVERELADRGVLSEPLGRNLPRRRQHRERDREVEARAFLAQARRREVDGDPLQRPLELRRADPAADAMLRLLRTRGRRARRSRSRGCRRRCAPRPRRGAARGRRARG